VSLSIGNLLVFNQNSVVMFGCYLLALRTSDKLLFIFSCSYIILDLNGVFLIDVSNDLL